MLPIFGPSGGKLWLSVFCNVPVSKLPGGKSVRNGGKVSEHPPCPGLLQAVVLMTELSFSVLMQTLWTSA